MQQPQQGRGRIGEPGSPHVPFQAGLQWFSGDHTGIPVLQESPRHFTCDTM